MARSARIHAEFGAYLARRYLPLTPESGPPTLLSDILGVCTTVLKKICREHGIRRWPQRKLQSINKMMASIECAMRNASA